jgi:hypothetical protein
MEWAGCGCFGSGVGGFFMFIYKNYARSAKIPAGLFCIRPDLNSSQDYHFKDHFWMAAD